MQVLSVNLARPQTAPDITDAPGFVTGIDKHPAAGPVHVEEPGPKGTGGSALAGDVIGDLRHHGGTYQAVYAFAREDLDVWGAELGRELPNGVFGENLTTSGVDVCGARIGERWRIGPDLLLEVTSSRIPCRTFAGWLGERGWVKRFTQAARPGAYLRVVEPGEIRAGDGIRVEHRPDHEVTAAFWFRANTLERELLPRLLAAADALHPESLEKARKAAARAS